MAVISSASPSSSFSSLSSTVLRNITIDDNDSSLKYSQGWSRSLSSGAIGGSLQIANGIGDMVQFNLPENAVALYYFGLGQTGGALYGVCVDCTSTDSGNLETFDAHTKVQSTGTSTLFSKTNLDPKVPHSFTLVNFPDSGFGGKSTITLDAFVITIQEEAVSSTSSNPALSSHSLATTSISMPSMAVEPMTELTQSSTTEAPAPVPSDDSTPPPVPATSTSTSSSHASSSTAGHSQSNLNTSSTSGLHIGSIRSPVALGGILVLLIVFVGMILFAIMYFMRRRRRRTKSPFVQIRAPEVEKFIDKNGPKGGSGNGTMVKVAPGAMVEQLVPDRPRPGGNTGGYSPAVPPGRVGGGPNPMPGRNPARRSFVDRLPARVSQLAPRTAPRTLFAAGAAARRPGPPVAYSSPLRNQVKAEPADADVGPGARTQDPFADADPFEEAEREAWMRQNGARAPVVAGHRRPEPALRQPAATSPPNMHAPAPSDDPFAHAELEARRRMAFQAGMGHDRPASVVSEYSQAGHEEPALPTPWLQGNKTQKNWELV